MTLISSPDCAQAVLKRQSIVHVLRLVPMLLHISALLLNNQVSPQRYVVAKGTLDNPGKVCASSQDFIVDESLLVPRHLLKSKEIYIFEKICLVRHVDAMIMPRIVLEG